MPRGPRPDPPGSIHHVMVRGIERGRIFHDDRDRLDLLIRLDRLVPETGARCLAWALIPNHFHLVVESSGALSRLMSRLGTGYAVRFNRRHDRVGHVFQNRFKSRLVFDDADLVNVLRYVSRNPLRHGLVERAEDLHRFTWCGVGSLIGRRSARPFEDVTAARLFLGQGARISQRQLERLLGDEVDEPADLEPDYRATNEDVCETAQAPHPRAQNEPADLDVLISQVCSRLRIDPAALRRGGRRAPAPAARAAVSYLAVVELGVPGAVVARALHIGPSAVSKALERGRQVVRDSLGVGFVNEVKERPP